MGRINQSAFSKEDHCAVSQTGNQNSSDGYSYDATDFQHISIWSWQLNLPDNHIETLLATLDNAEKARMQRFATDCLSRQFIASRGMMRRVLASCVNTEPNRLTFTYNAFGKPALSASISKGIHFNLSHSGNLAVLAVSPCFDLGIDVEQIKPIEEDISNRFFSLSERACLARMQPHDHLKSFYRCWTRKEAFVKAHGAGLSLPLDAFDVTVDPVQPPMITRLDCDPEPAQSWTLLNLETPKGYCGAVAALTVGNKVKLRYLDIAI